MVGELIQSPLSRRLLLRRTLAGAAGMTTLGLAMSACGDDGSTGTSGAASGPPRASDVKGSAVYLNYPGWIGPKTVGDFEKAYPGAQIKLSAAGFESTAGVAQTVAQNPSAYDLVMGSGDIAEQLDAGGFILPVNEDNVPALANVEPHIRKLFPLGVPIDTGVLGIGYRKDLVKEPISSWADFWNLVPKYSRKVVVVGLDRTALGSALIYKGFDPNTTDPDELEQAKQALIDIKEHVLAFKVSNIAQSLLDGSAAITLGYNYETAAAMAKDPNIEFVVPEEGAMGYIEGIIGVRQTDVPEVALAWMDFFLQPENYAGFVNATLAARTSKMADDLIDKTLVAPAFDLPENVHVLKFLGADGTKAFSRVWSEFQAS